MSVTLQNTPSALGFLGNRERFEWKCNNVDAEGTVCDMKYFLVDIQEMPIGSHLVLTIGGERYVFRVTTTPVGTYDLWCGEREVYYDDDGNVVEAPAVVLMQTAVEYAVAKMNACYYVSELLTVSMLNNGGMRFLGKETGELKVDLTSEKADGTATSGYVNIAVGSTYGSDDVVKDNYGLMVRVVSGDSKSDWMCFSPDNDGMVYFTPDIAGCYRQEMALPTVGGTGYTDIDDSVLEYGVEYAEIYGAPARIMSIVKSGSVHVLDGRQDEPFRSENKADWVDACGSSLSEGGSVVRVIADNGGLVTHRKSVPQYIYMTSATAGSVSGSIVLYNLDGTSETMSMGTHAVHAYGMVRYAIDLSNVRTDVYRYTVEINLGSGYKYRRTAYVMPDLYEKHLFLFTDRHGLLQTMDAERVAMTSVSDGTEVMRGDEHFVNVNDHHNVYTATTMAMNDDEKRLIGEAMRGGAAYYLKNGVWQKIALNTGSLEVVSGTGEVDVMAFSFRIVSE